MDGWVGWAVCVTDGLTCIFLLYTTTGCNARAQGKMVVVVDDEDRENEGDIIMAAVREQMIFE